MSVARRVVAGRSLLALLVLAGTVAALTHPAATPSRVVTGAPSQVPSTTRVVAVRPASTPFSTRPAPATAAPATTARPTSLPASRAVPTPAPSSPPTSSSPTTAAPAAATPGRQWAVGVMTLDLVDTSRSTPAGGPAPAQAGRALPTIVRYPVDGPATAPETAGTAPSLTAGHFPLIVFGHGYDSSPAVYAGLLHAWASAGYVVAAPAFPRGTLGGPLNESDLASEPGDLSFVLTRVLATSALSGVIDPAHIGLAGHSDGADAALGAGYDSCCLGRRVAADVVMAGDEHTYQGGSYFPPGSPPLLVTQADHDVYNPVSVGQQLFADARSPKYLLGLINATHLGPVTSDGPHMGVMEAATLGFFDRYLKGQADGVTRMRQAATPGLATLTAG